MAYPAACPTCGNPVPNAMQRFCAVCGRPLAPIQQPMAQVQPMPQAWAPGPQPMVGMAPPPKPNPTIIAVVVVVIILVVVLAIAAVVLLRPPAFTGFRVTAPGGGCWTGTFVGNGVSNQGGCGPRDIPMGCGPSGTAATVSKTESSGWTLTVEYLKDGRVLQSDATSASLGTVFIVLLSC